MGTLAEEAQSAAAYCGKIVLFVGVECKDWTPAQFGELATWAHAQGVDTIAPKRADGSIKWYGDPVRLAAERAAVNAAGCGYLPFVYCYGPAFSTKQIDDECAVLAEIMAHNDGGVCADLEIEYDGQWGAGLRFSADMQSVPGLLFLTSWGDPRLQNFPTGAIAPCVNAWVPQDYDNFLASCEQQQISAGETIIFPALDLTQEFGPNNVVQLAAAAKARGHLSLWLWNAAVAQANPALLAQVIAAFK